MFLPYLWYVKCRVCAIVGMQESAYLCNVNNKERNINHKRLRRGTGDDKRCITLVA